MRGFVLGKGVPLQQISIVSNGADASRFGIDTIEGHQTRATRKSAAERQRKLLYCGVLRPAHGREYLCDLAEEFLAQGMNVRIVVAGGGRLEDTLIDRVRQASCLGKTISLIGMVAQADVHSLYADADASIMTVAD